MCAIGGAQLPGQFLFRMIGRGKGDEHANGRGLSLFVHTDFVPHPGSGHSRGPSNAREVLAVAMPRKPLPAGGITAGPLELRTRRTGRARHPAMESRAAARRRQRRIPLATLSTEIGRPEPKAEGLIGRWE
ncbi:hypothetical protein GCM10018966_077790 [Streptomyces yanii]